jgi:hypothetical protein
MSFALLACLRRGSIAKASTALDVVQHSPEDELDVLSLERGSTAV